PDGVERVLVINGLDPPAGLGEAAQVGPWLVRNELESTQALGPIGVPPALIEEPGAVPPSDVAHGARRMRKKRTLKKEGLLAQGGAHRHCHCCGAPAYLNRNRIREDH